MKHRKKDKGKKTKDRQENSFSKTLLLHPALFVPLSFDL